MDLDAKMAADTLRKMADFKQMLAFPHDTGKIINACADLIESLAAELKITEAVAAQARGLECERDLLVAELEHVKQERDGLQMELDELKEEYYTDIHTARDPMLDKIKQLEHERDAVMEVHDDN